MKLLRLRITFLRASWAEGTINILEKTGGMTKKGHKKQTNKNKTTLFQISFEARLPSGFYSWHGKVVTRQVTYHKYWPSFGGFTLINHTSCQTCTTPQNWTISVEAKWFGVTWYNFTNRTCKAQIKRIPALVPVYSLFVNKTLYLVWQCPSGTV